MLATPNSCTAKLKEQKAEAIVAFSEVPGRAVLGVSVRPGSLHTSLSVYCYLRITFVTSGIEITMTLGLN